MKRFLALLLTFSMILMSSFVFAEGGENEAAATIVVKNEDGSILYEGAYDPIVFENYPDGKTYEITGTVDDDLHFEIGNAMLTVNGEVADMLRMKGEENLAMVFGDVGSGRAIVGVNTQNYYDDETPETIVNTSGTIVTGDAYGLSRGVAAGGKSAVAVNGDIKGGTAIDYVDEEGVQHNYQFGDGVYASGDSLVFAGNDVQGYSNGVNAEDNANVQADGDVIGGAEDKIVYPDGTTETKYEGSAVNTTGKAVVEIDGDVLSLNDGISAKDTTKTDPETYEEVPVPNQAAVTVSGNVTAENGQGIIAEGQAEIKVGGNVESEGDAVNAGDGEKYVEASVAVEGDVTSASGYGVTAYGDSAVTVGGDVTAYYDGVCAGDNADVKISGNIAAGHGDSPEDDERVGDSSPASGSGIWAANEATVLVDGNVSSKDDAVYACDVWDDDPETGEYVLENNGTKIAVTGDVTSEYGDGVVVEGTGKVNIEGNLTAYYDGIDSYENSFVQVGGSIEAGHEETQTDEEGKEETTGDGTGVMAGGKAVVLIGGNVDSKCDGIRTTDCFTYDEEAGAWVSLANTAVVSVEGDVTAVHGTGVSVSGKSGVSVKGDITARMGIEARNEYDYDRETGETKFVADESIIHIGGNVTASEDEAISTYGETEIYVGGNVSSEEDSAIEMGPDAKIRIVGDVTGGKKEEDGEAAEDEEKEQDEGKEEADTDEREDDPEGVVEILAAAEGTASGELIIEGTLSANDDSIPLLVEMAQDTSDSGEPDLSGIPELKIYEIVPTDGEYFRVKEDQSGEATEALAKYIQYIIKVTENRNGSIVLDGVTYDEDNDLLLAREDDEIGVTVTAKKGYRISGVDAGEVAELTDNGDGTWTVIVKRGGGVTISAIIVRKPHQADGKIIRYGHYDFDGDGMKEDLEWLCMSVSSGYARLALISGLDRIPDDFAKEGFTEDEMAGILNGEITELSAYETRKYFKDGKIHPVIFVKLDRIGY